MKITKQIKDLFWRYSKKTLAFTIISIALVTAISSMSISCVTLHDHLSYKKRTDTSPPTDAFAYVMVTKKAEAVECLVSPHQDVCKKVIKTLPPIIIEGTGSGLLVATKGKPIVLTAAHVCLPSFPETQEIEGVIIKIKTTSEVRIRTFNGDIFKGTIVSYNEESDLCAVTVSSIFAAPVRLAKFAPNVGDKVFAISAPFGINAPTMSLIFTGFYSGVDDNIHYYTIPTRPGSSGSVVLNDNYRAVGMLNGAFKSLENVGIGPCHAEIKKFISEIWNH